MNASMTSGIRAVCVAIAVIVVVALPGSAGAIPFAEFGDAGDLPGVAQAAGVLPVLTRISGSIGSSTDADMFAITVSTFGRVSATTVGTPGTLFDPQLFLFAFPGTGRLANDDSMFTLQATLPGTLLQPGLYFLGISAFDRDPVSAGGLNFPSTPFSGVFGPTGPGGGSPIIGWEGTGFSTPGTYAVDLQLTPVPEPATLLLLGTTMAGIGLTARRKLRRQQ
jgi:hypothetical protein